MKTLILRAPKTEYEEEALKLFFPSNVVYAQNEGRVYVNKFLSNLVGSNTASVSKNMEKAYAETYVLMMSRKGTGAFKHLDKDAYTPYSDYIILKAEDDILAALGELIKTYRTEEKYTKERFEKNIEVLKMLLMPRVVVRDIDSYIYHGSEEFSSLFDCLRERFVYFYIPADENYLNIGFVVEHIAITNLSQEDKDIYDLYLSALYREIKKTYKTAEMANTYIPAKECEAGKSFSLRSIEIAAVEVLEKEPPEALYVAVPEPGEVI